MLSCSRRGCYFSLPCSWFPAYDRNPQTFVDIYHAQPEDYRMATQTVYRSVENPPHLVLGVMR